MRQANGRFQPGASGNPRGRPRDRGLQHEIERALAKRIAGRTRLELMAEKVVEMALAGDMRAAEFIGKRLWPERPASDSAATVPLVILRDYTGRAPAPVETRTLPVIDVKRIER